MASYSNYPGGFSSGVVIRNSLVTDEITGDVFWVDSNGGGGLKGTFKQPFATIDEAITAATASHGDVIKVKPGHAENLSTAAIFALDKAGITVRGYGENLRKPTFSTTAAAGALMVTAANCVIENLRFVANFGTGTTQAIDLDAASDGTIIRGCDFRDTSAANEFLIHIDIATTVTDVIIENCTFITYAGSMTSSIYFTGASQDCIIRDNLFFVDASASVIDHLPGIATAIIVNGNRVVNIDSGAGLVLGIKSDSTSTGYVFNNYLQSPFTGAAVLAVTSDFYVAQNFCSNDINTSGVLNPAADAI